MILPASDLARNRARARVSRMPEIGKLFVIGGIIVALLGILLWSGYGNWLGKLPGDIRIERGSGGFYFPIVTCIVISLILTLARSLFRR